MKGDKIEIRLFFRFIGNRETINILKMLKDGNKTQYKDLATLRIGVSSLNIRIRVLLKNGLIEHHLRRSIKKEEWYTLSEKGERILKLIEEIEEIINSDQN
ncbi:MAG: winged helix-turn-helix transcriptional regulator [Theionarchaea archaeon]|nr:winged helix-turn-helix transcriptional regulator [Theionarchaea archaeon]